MHKVFIQKMKAMTSKTDWIDELDNSEDDQTFFQYIQSSIYESKLGAEYWWPTIIAMVQDDKRTPEESVNPQSYTSGAANKMTKKRVKREE